MAIAAQHLQFVDSFDKHVAECEHRVDSAIRHADRHKDAWVHHPSAAFLRINVYVPEPGLTITVCRELQERYRKAGWFEMRVYGPTNTSDDGICYAIDMVVERSNRERRI